MASDASKSSITIIPERIDVPGNSYPTRAEPSHAEKFRETKVFKVFQSGLDLLKEINNISVPLRLLRVMVYGNPRALRWHATPDVIEAFSAYFCNPLLLSLTLCRYPTSIYLVERFPELLTKKDDPNNQNHRSFRESWWGYYLQNDWRSPFELFWSCNLCHSPPYVIDEVAQKFIAFGELKKVLEDPNRRGIPALNRAFVLCPYALQNAKVLIDSILKKCPQIITFTRLSKELVSIILQYVDEIGRFSDPQSETYKAENLPPNLSEAIQSVASFEETRDEGETFRRAYEEAQQLKLEPLLTTEKTSPK